MEEKRDLKAARSVSRSWVLNSLVTASRRSQISRVRSVAHAFEGPSRNRALEPQEIEAWNSGAMAFKVFLKPTDLDPAEQALAWRLQTLAAAHGIEMYVPRRGFPFPSRGKELPRGSVENAIDRSDCVLAIITAEANASVQKELEARLTRGENW